MNGDEIIELLSLHWAEAAALGVKRLAVFGSAARGELKPGSDVDVLVEFAGPATFDQYMDLKFLLEKLLARRVDLVTRKALKPQLRESIEKEAVYVP